MQGGIIDKDMPVPVSAVAIVCPTDGPTRIGNRIDETGSKVRVCKQVREGPVMTVATAGDRPRLKVRYDDRVAGPAPGRALGLANIMVVPRLEKIVVNMGVGPGHPAAVAARGRGARPRDRSPARSRW